MMMTMIMTMITTKNLKKLLLIISLGPLLSIGAQDILIPEIVIEAEKSVDGSTLDPYQSFKSERVSSSKLNDQSRKSVADLVKDQVGVDTQTYCANCGAKRLTINGLKGEHTSLLIDRVPLHSAVSSFYGVDTVPIFGLQDVLVMRGAGASLSNPEAIGGTLNLVTIDPFKAQTKIQTGLGINDYGDGQSQNHAFLVGLPTYELSAGGKTAVTFGGQFFRDETWDEDNNNLSELPQRTGKNFFTKGRLKKGSHDYSVRLAYADLEILGGFADPQKPSSVRTLAAGESDFINGSVEERFTGDPSKVTDWINLNRIETALTGTSHLGGRSTLEVKGGYARQEQKAIYQHGFDYTNIDNLFVGDVALVTSLPQQVVLKTGAFIKDQRMRSDSQALFEKYAPTDPNDIAKDSFDYQSQALYGELSYLTEKFEVNLALRLDRINMNWLELSNKIDDWVAAPRFVVMHTISEHLTQRFSYGLGYRAPLTFFESQHGNEENGYEVDINDLEKAHSFVYSLSYNTPNYYVTGSAHYTSLKNMAFGFEQFNQPIRYRNSSGVYDIFVADLLVGYKPQEWWLIEGTFEIFEYQEAYKRKLPSAAIEKRLTLRSTLEREKWAHTFQAQIVPGRDLSAYGRYYDHYVRRNQSFEPLLDSSLEKKDLRSRTFMTIDTSVSYKATNHSTFTLAINNLTDYTQVSAGDSPATWHWHFNHAHYDGLHTWGPNAGRQFFFNYQYTF